VRALVGAARAEDRPSLPRILAEHLGTGLDAWPAEPRRSSQLVGVVSQHGQPVELAQLLTQEGPSDRYGPRPGNAASVNVACGPDGRVRPCVRCGIHLVTEPGARSVVLVWAPMPQYGHESVSVQVVSTEEERAPRAAAEIRAAALQHNVFRGQVLSFGQEVFGHGQRLLQFHRRPTMSADELILASETLAGIQRRSSRWPGTRAASWPRASTSSGVCCSTARRAPARRTPSGTRPAAWSAPAEDADIVFVPTPNRADLLEPALAARSGRVDEAVSIDLPGPDARRRLFDLYRGRLAVDTSGLEDVITRTEGVTASFLQELLRRAAPPAASRDGDGEPAVSADHLGTASTSCSTRVTR
jgi:hypothetical protein